MGNRLTVVKALTIGLFCFDRCGHDCNMFRAVAPYLHSGLRSDMALCLNQRLISIQEPGAKAMNDDQRNVGTDPLDTTRVVATTGQDSTVGSPQPGLHSKQDYDLQGGPEGLGVLVNGVIGDVQNIVRSEVRLAQVELKQEVGTLAGAAAMGVAAALAGLVGFILLMIGVSLLLAQWLDDWLAFVIGGVGLFLIAGVLAMTAKNRLSAANLKPERTIDSLQQDKAWAQDQAQSLKENQT